MIECGQQSYLFLFLIHWTSIHTVYIELDLKISSETVEFY
jgi:hypothetical protein